MKPGEHKTVQARILHYAGEIGWTFVSRREAEQRRGFDIKLDSKERAKGVAPLNRLLNGHSIQDADADLSGIPRVVVRLTR